MASRGKPLSTVDSAWLRMDDPTNLMTITGVMTFERKPEWPVLRETLLERLACYERFRQRVEDPGTLLGSARWIEENFEIDEHLVRAELPGKADEEELKILVSQLMAQPFAAGKPLWQIHFVENYRTGGALVARIHHCIGDGLALVQVLLNMTDTRPKDDSPPEPIPLDPTMKNEAAQSLRGTSPRRGRVGRGFRWLRAGGSAAWTLGELAVLSADPQTIYRGGLGVEKKAVWSEAFALEEVKQIGKKLGATINDVLLSALAGALRHYAADRGAKVPKQVRAVVPVNLRRPDDRSLGNKFGLVFLPLPVGEAEPVERLFALKREMDALKRSPQAFVAFAVLQAIGATTAKIEEIVLKIFAKKATAVATNVPGPREPLFFCGTKVRSIMFWVPQAGRLGMGVSILSYAGTVRVGVTTDVRLVPDPEKIVAAYERALDELRQAAAGA